MAGITKERVLGDLTFDLIMKGEKLYSGGHREAANAFFDLAVKVVENLQPRMTGAKPASSGDKSLPR